MTNWQPIASAPRDGTFILVCAPGLETGPVTIATYFNDGERDERGRFKRGEFIPANWSNLSGWLGIDGDTLPSWCDPTHWAPLPEPPERK